EAGPEAAAPSESEARARTISAARRLGYPAAEYAVLEVGREQRPKRVDTTVVLQASPSGLGEAHPRLTAVFHGRRLAFFLPTIQVPETFLRAQRKRSALEMLLLGVKIVAAGGRGDPLAGKPRGRALAGRDRRGRASRTGALVSRRLLARARVLRTRSLAALQPPARGARARRRLVRRAGRVPRGGPRRGGDSRVP